MTDAEIIAWLREQADFWLGRLEVWGGFYASDRHAVYAAAADRIEALLAETAALRAKAEIVAAP